MRPQGIKQYFLSTAYKALMATEFPMLNKTLIALTPASEYVPILLPAIHNNQNKKKLPIYFLACSGPRGYFTGRGRLCAIEGR